ncbi:transglycosylase domain-containing protein [Pontibacillus sp. HMF3514]|uniref:transglycosylase domain-containing protein n=1 Tax=Pontibacillus sp. HMF3514 TaxID=2692425 RepID=UPI001F478427|nr:PBP1A family penicillin-binding protein [Pontibacillus sp. HMF3514]
MKWNLNTLHPKRWGKKTRWAVIALISTILLTIGGYYLLLMGGKSVVDKKLLVLDQASQIETADGEVLTKLYKQNRTVVSIDEIPQHVEDAFIAIEDTRFYEHSGIDLKAIARAIYRDIIAMEKVEGGSTITQQLSKNLFLTNDKTWTRKFKEIMAALYLEQEVSKERILQYYLNTIYFGNGIYGVEEASQYFFNKPIEKLTISEGALLAALPKAPNYYDPVEHPERAKQRRNLVLNRMHETGMVSTEKVVQLQRKTLGIERGNPEKKPWMNSYIDLVIKEATEEYDLSKEELYQGGFRIVVGVDQDIQESSYEAMQNDDYFPGSTKGVEGSFLLMEEKTGRIVAAHGGRNYQRGDLNRIHIKQQPGSVMKPLAVYGPALDLPNYQPYSVLEDKKRSYGEYQPENYDNRYEGQVSLYKALQQSKNAPAVWLLNKMGVDYAKDYLNKMGMNLSENGLSIALGGLKEGVTPMDMVRSYRSFIHGGEMIEPHTILKIYNQNGELVSHHKDETKQIFQPQTAWSMTRMLQSVVKDGTARAGSYSKALAGKTGSTQHPMVSGKTNDAWFVGYTPNYVGAVWMGYDKIDKNHYLNSGSAYPTRLIKDVLSKIDQKRDLQASFVKPEGVEDVPEPIELPVIDDLQGTLSFGSLTLIKGKLTWTPSSDNRVVYRIYRVESGQDAKVGEVTGKGSYQLDRVKLFDEEVYYVVPYNPLTKLEGEPSNRVKVSLDW